MVSNFLGEGVTTTTNETFWLERRNLPPLVTTSSAATTHPTPSTIRSSSPPANSPPPLRPLHGGIGSSTSPNGFTKELWEDSAVGGVPEVEIGGDGGRIGGRERWGDGQHQSPFHKAVRPSGTQDVVFAAAPVPRTPTAVDPPAPPLRERRSHHHHRPRRPFLLIHDRHEHPHPTPSPSIATIENKQKK